MPNNTANKLQFLCFDDAENEFENILELFKSEKSELDFQKIIPLYFGQDPRDVWDTKWNAYSIHIVKSRMSLTFFFQTAWNWPEPVIERIFTMFPHLYVSFNAACEGGWFAVSINKDSDRSEVDKKVWDSESGNDENGQIRAAMHSALVIN